MVRTAAALVWPGLASAAAPAPLDGPRREAPGGPARFLIVMLHGYNASGETILRIAKTDRLQAACPTAAVSAPNGPSRTGVYGYSWSPVRDGGDDQPSLVEIAQAIGAYADAELARLGLPPERLILLGFSQGAGMALNVGLRRAVAPAAVVAFSGPYLADAPLGPGKPPVLLVHGANDRTVSPDLAAPIAERLAAAQIPVESHMLDGIGHRIDSRGVDLAAALIGRVTG